MPTRAIATSTLWQIASQATMAALSILTVKFVAVGLTKELAGNYNSAYGFLQLFGILADFGLYAVAVREVAVAKDKSKVLGALIVLRCIILVISLTNALLFVWLLPSWRGTPFPMSVTIASLVPLFTLAAGILRTIFQVEYRMQYVFIAEVVQRIITVSLIGVVILLGVRQTSNTDVLYFFLAVGGLGAFILLLLSVMIGNTLIKIRPCVDKNLLKKLTATSAPFGLAFLATALYRQFDITLIALLRDDFEIQNAYYGFVVRMTDMGYLIPTFLLNSVLPTLSSSHKQKKGTQKLLGKTLLIILTLGSISALFSLLWPRPLIALLTTEAYLSTATAPGSDTALRIFSLPLFLNGLILYGFYVLLTKHAWKPLVTVLLGAAGISILLNMILIPIFGFTGAASTSVIVHILLTAVLVPLGLRAMPFSISIKDLSRWATFTLLLGLSLWTIQPLLVNELTTVIGLTIATVLMGIFVMITKLHRSVLS